jgi:hypothetical protein
VQNSYAEFLWIGGAQPFLLRTLATHNRANYKNAREAQTDSQTIAAMSDNLETGGLHIQTNDLFNSAWEEIGCNSQHPPSFPSWSDLASGIENCETSFIPFDGPFEASISDFAPSATSLVPFVPSDDVLTQPSLTAEPSQKPKRFISFFSRVLT